MMGSGFTTAGGWFLDGHGRHTLLRGVNLSGATKVPANPDGATHLGVSVENWQHVSFVGRPAPLDELDSHLERIVSWGWNCLRLLTTWEAIEHAGPGRYDDAYLEYYREVVRRAGERGLWVIVDPHQDVWSRWTGGDGAPFWCFELAGLVPERFAPTGAVAIHAQDWPENYQRAPVATMWTLLYGGDTFCPPLAGVQRELQDRYIAALAALAERVADLDNVLGYDTLNEPSNGYIGLSARSLQRGARHFDQEGPPPFSPLEYLVAADGVTVRRGDGAVLNPSGESIWVDGCPWRRAGVWDVDGTGVAQLLRPDHFREIDGRRVHPWADFHVPFIRRIRERLRAAHPGCLLFLEGSPWDIDTPWDDPDPLVVNARHWYDIATLATRRFDPDAYHPGNDSAHTISGWDAVAAEFAAQLGALRDVGRDRMGDPPMLIGEFGIPYEMNGAAAFSTGDFSVHEELLHATYDALDDHLLNGTQWCYTPDNDHAHGDQWNNEDLSVFCEEDGGGRAVRGFARPFARHSQGRPVAMQFDRETRRFELTLAVDSAVATPTEVVAPVVQYPDGVAVEVATGTVTVEGDVVHWKVEAPADRATLVVRPRG
jgi:Cellulase (glycosyl hydrolase family 5)/Glycoside hydrolase family 5 C-terminal domain